jgi:hypothetical protein
MRQDIIYQYSHFWEAFSRVVRNFHGYDWRYNRNGGSTPDRLAYNILRSTRYYTQDEGPLLFGSRRSFMLDKGEILPSQEEILSLHEYFHLLSVNWVDVMFSEGESSSFSWNDQTCRGTAFSLLRQNSYHLGKLEGLLNEKQQNKINGLLSPRAALFLPAYSS